MNWPIQLNTMRSSISGWALRVTFLLSGRESSGAGWTKVNVCVPFRPKDCWLVVGTVFGCTVLPAGTSTTWYSELGATGTFCGWGSGCSSADSLDGLCSNSSWGCLRSSVRDWDGPAFRDCDGTGCIGTSVSWILPITSGRDFKGQHELDVTKFC